MADELLMVMIYGAFIVSFLMNILIAAYMYGDAEKRGKEGIVWGLIGFFFGITALIVWLIVRPPASNFHIQHPPYPPPYGPPYQQYRQAPGYQYPYQQPQYPPNPPPRHPYSQYGEPMYSDAPGQHIRNNPQQYQQNDGIYDPYKEPPKEE